jgi:tRNA (Thr-GGU) A37 N-methylase
VFGTRSHDRSNLIGRNRVEIVSIDGLMARVRNREALDETPILDVEPLLGTCTSGRSESNTPQTAHCRLLEECHSRAIASRTSRHYVVTSRCQFDVLFEVRNQHVRQ